MENLTPPEIAKLFGVSPDTIRRLIDNGQLPSVRFSDDGWRYVDKSAVVEYAKKKGIKLDWSTIE
ncbi:MAG: helix-turn-helix domain-containing protein [Rhizobiales bacterium]|nr:helix-turn-helix domain-containing protein [Hyphomicrobiales bacterium]